MHAWEAARASGKLEVVFAPTRAETSDLIWIAIDTPIRADGSADWRQVITDSAPVLNNAQPRTIVIVSSQLPAGTMAKFYEAFPHLIFVCQPENLRIGNGMADFLNPDRIVVGLNDSSALQQVKEVFGHFSSNLLFMSIESAEQVKHAINCYLSMTIAFANEFGEWAKKHGANLKDVERAMKSDLRIGQRAYVGYGGGPGPNLGRDLKHMSDNAGGLFTAIKDAHARFGESR